MKRATTFAAMFVTIFWVIQLTGCLSAPGVVISSAVEISEPNPELRVISDWHFESVKRGTKLQVLLFSGGELTGKFRGLTPLGEQEYARKYAQCRTDRSAAASLPALGDAISFTDTAGRRYEGEFVGFDQGFLLVNLPARQAATRVNVRMLKEITLANGQVLPSVPVSSLVFNGQIPFRSSAILETKEGMATIPLEEISSARITEPPGKTGRTVIAVVFIAAMAVPIFIFLLKPLMSR